MFHIRQTNVSRMDLYGCYALYNFWLSDLDIICNNTVDWYRRVFTEIVLDFTILTLTRHMKHKGMT